MNAFFSKKTRIIFIIVFLLLFLAILVVTVNAQNQTVEALTTRLDQYGVPVKSISIINRLPLEIEIVLQSMSTSKQASLDDLWNAQLARREASLAYLLGIKINSYKLVYVDDQNKVIGWEQYFLSPSDPSQKISGEFYTPNYSNDETKKLISSSFDFDGMTIDLLDVSDDALSSQKKTVLMQLTAPDIGTANNFLPKFIPTFRNLIGKSNSEKNTNIALFRMKVVDKKGENLLIYVWDFDISQETSISAKGLAPWYPVPETPANSLTTATQTPLPYPAPTMQTSTPGSYP